MKNYYAILGLPSSATPAEIDAAFRSLARKYHPDLRPEGEDATSQFKLVTEAHEVLSNAEKRREYDRAQHRGQRVPSTGRLATKWQTESTGWVKMPWPSAPPSGGALDVEAVLHVAPEEAARGGPIELRVSIPEPCPCCRSKEGGLCQMCGGKGMVDRSHRVSVLLPPGVRNGTVLRLPRYGRAAALGGPRGDLLLRVRVRPCW